MSGKSGLKAGVTVLCRMFGVVERRLVDALAVDALIGVDDEAARETYGRTIVA